MKTKFEIKDRLPIKISRKFDDYFTREAKTQTGITRIIKDYPKEELSKIYQEIVEFIDIFEKDKNTYPFYFRKELALHTFYELRPEFKKKYMPKMSVNALYESENAMQYSSRVDLIYEYAMTSHNYYEKYPRRNPDSGFFWSEFGSVIKGLAILIFIILLIMQYIKESNCESVTYYEYGEKKTGQVCDDSAKYQLRNNIDETNKRKNN